MFDINAVEKEAREEIAREQGEKAKLAFKKKKNCVTLLLLSLS